MITSHQEKVLSLTDAERKFIGTKILAAAALYFCLIGVIVASYHLNAHWAEENFGFFYVSLSVIVLHTLVSIAFAVYISKQVISISVTNKGMWPIYGWLVAAWYITQITLLFDYDLTVAENLEHSLMTASWPAVYAAVVLLFFVRYKRFINEHEELKLKRNKAKVNHKKPHDGNIDEDWEMLDTMEDMTTTNFIYK